MSRISKAEFQPESRKGCCLHLAARHKGTLTARLDLISLCHPTADQGAQASPFTSKKCRVRGGCCECHFGAYSGRLALMDDKTNLAAVQADMHQRRSAGIFGNSDVAANDTFARRRYFEMLGPQSDLHGPGRRVRCRGQAHGGQRQDVHLRTADELRDEQIAGSLVEFARRADLLDEPSRSTTILSASVMASIWSCVT